jgi:hypothetical protein
LRPALSPILYFRIGISISIGQGAATGWAGLSLLSKIPF